MKLSLRNLFLPSTSLEDKLTVRKIPYFHLISWCGNFAERQTVTFRAIRPKTT